MELSKMDKAMQFKIPTKQDIARIQITASQQLQQYADGSVVCCVCELHYARENVKSCTLSDVLVKNLVRILRTPGNAEVRSFIRKQYDASSLNSRLGGVLLYPSGMIPV
ncbi:hypothetical protein F443_10043 [Phytophthora nicotianae P1569]|uniref:Uncharacterized protein n=1 Tax=Phytophthora nicotianae P1569 TaxID=1317065 RepID=V9F4W7_PHYNI|nr:hypothetical protein F443_10043 [Phytophthora nicotianae P1569]